MSRDTLAMVGVRASFRVQVDNAKATADVSLNLGQPEILFIEMRKIPAAGNFIELSVEIESQPVKRATDGRPPHTSASVGCKLHAAVGAGVYKGADLHVIAAYDEN